MDTQTKNSKPQGLRRPNSFSRACTGTVYLRFCIGHIVLNVKSFHHGSYVGWSVAFDLEVASMIGAA